MRIAYLGSGAFGLPTLGRLAREHEVVGVVTNPDRPAGRGGRTSPTPVADLAAADLPGVPVLKPERVRDAVDEIRALPVEALVVIAYGHKLPESLLEGRFAINLHASLLPRWRGAAPINAAVLAGDERTGNSVITLAPRMDAGEILGQSERPIGPTDTAGDLHDRLAQDGSALVLSVLESDLAGTLERRSQNEAQATYAGKLSKADGYVDLALDADSVRRRINGLSPWPGVTVRFRGEPLRLLRAGPDGGNGAPPNGGYAGPPGRVLDPATGLVSTGSGAVRLLEVQPAGKRAMEWSDFARGRRVESGEAIEGRIPGPR